MKIQKILIISAFLIFISGCDRRNSEAQRLGFRDVAEMEDLTARGYKNKSEYIKFRDEVAKNIENNQAGVGAASGDVKDVSSVSADKSTPISNLSSELIFEKSKESVLDCFQEYSAAITVYKRYLKAFTRTYQSDPQLQFLVGAIRVSSWDYVSGATYSFMLGTSKGYMQNRNESEWDSKLMAKINAYGDNLSIDQLKEVAQKRTNLCTSMIGRGLIDKINSKIFVEEDAGWRGPASMLQLIF